jgi:hypothetical protein
MPTPVDWATTSLLRIDRFITPSTHRASTKDRKCTNFRIKAIASDYKSGKLNTPRFVSCPAARPEPRSVKVIPRNLGIRRGNCQQFEPRCAIPLRLHLFCPFFIHIFLDLTVLPTCRSFSPSPTSISSSKGHRVSPCRSSSKGRPFAVRRRWLVAIMTRRIRLEKL